MNKLIGNNTVRFLLILALGMFLGWLIFQLSSAGQEHQADELSEESTTYTCSMHPQIRQGEPGQCPICGMDLIPATRSSNEEGSSPFVYTMSQNAVALANIQTQKVTSLTTEHEIQLSGKVALNEQKVAVITANYAGRIENLYVDFTGQTVQTGQKLATIYSPELVTAQMELIQASKFREMNSKLYEAAREKLRLWKITESQIDEIVKGEVVITEFEVIADRSGVVISREVSRGDYVNKGNVLFEIADFSNVWILFDAYESDLPFLNKGQQLSFTTPSLPGREFNSLVSFIDPMINPKTRTVAVRAEVPNPGLLLKPEMFVNGKIAARSHGKGELLSIPNTSILWTGKRSIVYIKIPNVEFPTYEMREITLGPAMGDYYQIKSGLSEGEEIVTNGVFAVDAASQLSGNYSMMNRAINYSFPVPDKFSSQLNELLNQYFQLNNSLVQSDFETSKSNISQFEAVFKRVETELPEEEAEKTWSKQHTQLESQIQLLMGAKDLEEQRKLFSELSNQLLEIIEAFRIGDETVYWAYCPMALNNEGAHWLSKAEEINNPYFGDRMLRCGEIIRTIRRDGKQESPPNQHQGHQH